MRVDTAKRVNAGDVRVSLAGVLAAFVALERRCVEAGLLGVDEAERYREARITLAVRAADEDRPAVEQRVAHGEAVRRGRRRKSA